MLPSAAFPLLLGLDLSTTSAKALLMDARGQVLDSASSPLELSTPRPLWSEQDPYAWWKAMVSSIHQVLTKTGLSPAAIAAIGLTGQMHGLVLLDERGEVLRPAILWNDQRTVAQCTEIRARLGKERLIQISGNDALTGFTAPKVLWVQQNEPEIYSRVRHILLPKDYIRFRLSGEYALDKADSSGTILFDLHKRDWSPEILSALDIPSEWLPPTFEGTAVTGYLTGHAAEESGLREGTPVMAGGGDQSAQAVGVGAVQTGIIALTLGTSGVVFAATERALIEAEGRLHAFCHAAPGMWHLMGVMLSAAGSLQWHRDTLTPGVSFDELTREAADAPAGCEGLFFLPYLSGERTPHADPLARAAWVGLTLRHTRPHLTRAVLEGVAFGLKDSFTLIKQAGLGEIRQVRVSGGGSKSPLWRQILADVLNIELATVNTSEGAAYGAALLAGVGAGVWENVLASCNATIRVTGCTPPSSDANVYQMLYPRYRKLYPALWEEFHC